MGTFEYVNSIYTSLLKYNYIMRLGSLEITLTKSFHCFILSISYNMALVDF
jgi:hypothetical protein